jgi:hypothetical protein
MPRLLFSGIECRDKDHVVAAPLALAGKPACRGCLVGDAMPERGGLLWVGGRFYEKPEDFMREARIQGVSRRIAAVPKGFVPGETVVYLAHRKVPNVLGLDKTAGVELTPMPAVFTAFVPKAIEYVVKGNETEEDLKSLEARGLELVDVKREQGEFEFEEDESE